MIRFTPAQALMDEPITIRLSGLPPKKPLIVKARMLLLDKTWQSQATFIADEHGRVDLGKQAPTGGSYTGVDPMGLFWSMTPDAAQTTPQRKADVKVSDPVVTSFDVEMEGRTVVSANLTRWWAKPGVRVTEVRQDGLVGKFFEPQQQGRHPAVLVLSGSEGGIKELDAALLASRGYAAFALAYFGTEDLPKELANIPLEYLKRGIDWMRNRNSVDGDRLGVTGGSKGAELSLLLASMFPEIKAVVAYAPSSIVGAGITSKNPGSQPSWTYQGKPLPFARCKATPAFTSQFASNAPVRLLELYGPCMQDKEAINGAAIPVERINGAVLLISGNDDQMGPSSLVGEMVVDKLKAHKHPHAYQHLSYEGAGHAIGSFYAPTTASTRAGRWALGGSPEGNARAIADSRPKVLRFLKESLASRALSVRKLH